MELIARTIVKYSSNPFLALVKLFEITLFSFLTVNSDLHLENFILFYDKEMIHLSPAYDLLSTRLLIPEKIDNEELALPMNGKKRKFRKEDFIQFAVNMKLNQKQIENVFYNFQEKLPLINPYIEKSFLNNELKDNI